MLIEAENKFNALLPNKRLVAAVPADLLTAGREWSAAVWGKAEKLGPMPLSDDEIATGLQLLVNPVFICGVHRSGTTLVRDLLDGHPDLVVLPSEGTYYTNLEAKILALPEKERLSFLGMEWLRRLANPINQAPYWLLGRSTDTSSAYVDFARYLMAWWLVPEVTPQTAVILAYASCTGKLGAKLWVDKTPTNERFLKRIWREMPNAKIIHVIREPLATMESRRKMEPTITLKRALCDLKTSFRIAIEQSALNDKWCLLVRYEDLCNDPEIFAEQVGLFLNIDVWDTLKQPTVAGIPAKANSSFENKAITGEILKPDEHKQVEVLSKAEQRFISANVGKLAAQLGYTLAPVNTFLRMFLGLKYWF